MNEYIIYFTILNTKFKMKIQAYDKFDARNKLKEILLNKIKFYTDESFGVIDNEEEPRYNDILDNTEQLDFLKNIFGMK